jgi:hypothetical protein
MIVGIRALSRLRTRRLESNFEKVRTSSIACQRSVGFLVLVVSARTYDGLHMPSAQCNRLSRILQRFRGTRHRKIL